MKSLAWILLAIVTLPTLGQAKDYPLNLTIWETEAFFRKPDGKVTTCVVLGHKPSCNSVDMQLQTLLELVSLATVADGKVYFIVCVNRTWSWVDLNDPVRLGIVSPGDYKARWDKGKLRILFFGKDRRWDEQTFAVKKSYPLTPELQRQLSDQRDF
jgi:hypothetical protein